MLESRIKLRIHFANYWSIYGVDQNPVISQNILVTNARELRLTSDHGLCCIAQLGGEGRSQLEQLYKANLRDTAVVVVPPRAPTVRPREQALEKPQLEEGYVNQQPGVEE